MTNKAQSKAPFETPTLGRDLLQRDVARRATLKAAYNVSSEAPRRNDLLPRLQTIDRELQSLSLPKRNVRKIQQAHVKEVANAISSFGFRVPILIDKDGVIIDGAVRFEAAKQLGLPAAPCIVVEDLTPAEQKLLRLALNRLGEKGTWDLDELKYEIEELIVEDAPLTMSGFDLVEIDGILAEPELREKGPVVPEGKAVAILGDVFQLGRHRLVCGDARSLQVLDHLMGDDLATLVFTDQPYNVAIAGHVTKGPHREFAMATGEMSDEQFHVFNTEWIESASSHLVDGGLLGTFIDWRRLVSVSQAAMACALKQINLIVWTKTNAGMGSLYRSQHEMLPLFKKGDVPHVNNVDLGRKGRWRSNVWSYPGASSIGSDARKGLQNHPTVKPTSMLQDALLDLTNRGDIVLDPFLGSGSTLIAAEKTGRVCRGIEIDPRYVDVIIRRYEEQTGVLATLEETGETFSTLEQRRGAAMPLCEVGKPNDESAVPMLETASDEPTRTETRIRIRTRRSIAATEDVGLNADHMTGDANGDGAPLNVVKAVPRQRFRPSRPTIEGEMPTS